MKLLKILLPLLFAISFAFSEQPAQFGRLLSKKYIEMKTLDQTIVLIYLKDKGTPKNLRELNASSLISQRSANRRIKALGNKSIISEADLPLENSYINEISKNVIQIRHHLKWFNAVTAKVTKQQIDIIKTFPFVKEIELVGRWRKTTGDEDEQPIKYSDESPTTSGTTSLDYGTSYTQVNQIKVPQVHNLGIYGQGVVVCVLDNGFRLLTHESFASMNIIAQHDFVDHKESVIPYNPNTGFGSHGVNTLSTIGGYKPGQLIGPAFKADYILARTENDSSETPIEEDNWAAAIQWADSIGVDVTSTSLGYLTYDAPYTSWTWADMNGNTTLITKAADKAVSLGIVVVNSAGNSGAGDGIHNTLGAPADGDSVIAAGAVTSTGVRTSFSSVGPTADGRTKPDIMAMGSGVKVASSTITTGYGTASGTSFSCPLSAGVAALILSANPTLTPMQVRDAMRNTASNAASPNNLMGWGILNTDSAIKYFGPLPLGKISGKKFIDVNGNGSLDAGEPPIEGTKIFLSGAGTDSTVTDSQGIYYFDSLEIGNYNISADLQAGWVRTTNPSYSINLLHGVDTAGFNFGIFKLGSVSGTVFNDSNYNGILDQGESRLANWNLSLSGPATYHATSDSYGNFSFTDIGTGAYTLSESTQVGWSKTTPLDFGYLIEITSGVDTSGFVFGNYYLSDTTSQIRTGWNLLSLPNKLTDHNLMSIYPSAISDAFIYAYTYVPLDTVPEKVGFWLKSSQIQNIIIDGTPRLIDTIDVVAGWNLIGTLSVAIPRKTVIQIPDSIITSDYFTIWDGDYAPDTSLRPHYGYWVKTKSSGKLVLNALATQTVTSVPAWNHTPIPSNSITIEDRMGNNKILYFGFGNESKNYLEKYELPPSPPDGIFDVRFSNNQQFAIADASKNIFPITISSADYPLTIRWKTSDLSCQASLIIDGNGIRLNEEGKTQISNQASQIQLKLSDESLSELPRKFELEQNYPNPFNPTTTIRYQLSVSSFATLRVYNIFGQEVKTLFEGFQEAGNKSIEFKSENLASGIYYYKLTASASTGSAFIDVKKMILIR
ncbi:MAG: S8 family serine peptidase [Ignavibacteriales bacterium]|nr:S8 family serine peptidase [Ignavibacteriales bacterium]